MGNVTASRFSTDTYYLSIRKSKSKKSATKSNDITVFTAVQTAFV